MGRFDGIYLFTDLDNTMTNRDKLIPKANIEAIRHFIAEGGRIGVATARSPYDMPRNLSEIRIKASSINHNGGAICDVEKCEFLYCRYIDRVRSKKLISAILNGFPDASVRVYTDKGIFQTNFNPDHWRNPAVAMEGVRDTVAALDDIRGGWLDVELCYPEEKIQRVLDAVDYHSYEGDYSIVHSGDVYYEFLAPNVNKGNGLKKIREMLGTGAKRILAIGDYYNDIEMLLEADAACAPSNAADEIKSICKYHAVSCDDGAIADFLEQAVFSGKEMRDLR